MILRQRSFLGVAALVLAMTFWSTGEVSAQRRGGGGRGGGGFRAGGSAHVGRSWGGGVRAGSAWRGGVAPHGDRDWHGGYRGWGWRPYGYYGLYRGLYGYPWYSGYSYYDYPSVYVEPYASTTYVVPSNTYSSYYAVPSGEEQTEIATASAAPLTAEIDIQVPDENAQIWLDGQPTQQQGTLRPFVTPPLEPGRSYSYQVRAHWVQSGQVHDETRTIQFQPGNHLTVTFGS